MAGYLLRAFGAAQTLETVDVSGFFIGQILLDDAGAGWQLTVSTAALDATHKAVAGVTGLRWVSYSGGGGGGFPATATALTKDNTGSPSGNIPLSGLTGPGLLQFALDGTPTKATAANLATAILSGDSLMNEVITAGGLSTDLVLAPAGWTLNGDTDGGYILEGVIITPAGSQATSYYIQPNALATNQIGRVMIDTSGSSITNADLTGMFIGSGTVNAGRLTFRATLSAKSGRVRFYECKSLAYDATTGGRVQRFSSVEWNATATVIDATTRLHGDAANGIGAGSTVKVIRTGMAA